MARVRLSSRGMGASLVLALGLVLQTSSLPAEEPRDQQIADIEKQIQTLNKKLAELRTTTPITQPATPEGTIPADWIKALSWRCIGPANMGGRITAISV